MNEDTSSGKYLPNQNFPEVLQLIQQGKKHAFQTVNVVLIETYWQVGKYLFHKVSDGGWGKSIVKELSAWLLRNAHGLKGFSAQNLWRMKQFYEIYKDDQNSWHC